MCGFHKVAMMIKEKFVSAPGKVNSSVCSETELKCVPKQVEMCT